ncbi:MAG: anthranilate phosphoribosyltransferase [Candidatus Omnitrophica bacterium 4484_70.1]|nr:MAG: anthranilate phosphoribosyltransferase [Candidatus Omnitrophica bacterium 4484_70.1]
MKDVLNKLLNGKDLSFNETREIFLQIFEEKLSPSQIAGFLVALRMKGESDEEIAAGASVAREKVVRVNVRRGLGGVSTEEVVFDTCGTGGSGSEKFNISTCVAFVVSASGVMVAKHGNRAASSKCGSADVLEALGINIQVPPSVMEEAIRKVGIGFLYAPLYHKAFKVVALIRKELGIRTIFNILGPLCNPAFSNYQLLGVYDDNLVFKIAKAMRRLGQKKVMVVFGKDVKDEISLTGRTRVSFLNNKKIVNFFLSPSDFGLKRCKLKDLEVKDKEESGRVIEGIFAGEKGPARDVVLANASVCFYMLRKVKNFKEGVELGAQLIDEGKVKSKFWEFKRFLEEKG